MSCTREENEKNAERAKQERPGVRFGAVSVTLTSVTDSSVSFVARGEDDQEHPFTCKLSEVWRECPSSAQKAGDQGDLYLSKEGLEATSDRDQKTRIKGTKPDAAGNVAIQVKWPDSGGQEEPTGVLRVWPTSIVIEGYVDGDPSSRGRVSLLDLGHCGAQQELHISQSGAITLVLTDEGFRRFGRLLPEQP
ncbi:MAG: hypothetical protein R3B48_10410 [Kofleriaceae bacterium]